MIECDDSRFSLRQLEFFYMNKSWYPKMGGIFDNKTKLFNPAIGLVSFYTSARNIEDWNWYKCRGYEIKPLMVSEFYKINKEKLND